MSSNPRAHAAVLRAIKEYRLPAVSTQKCVDCGAPATMYHHWSYEEQHHLDVLPVCRPCHRVRHAGEPSWTAPVENVLPSRDPKEERPLTVAELATAMRVKPITVRRWLHAGAVKGQNYGGRTGWRIPWAEVRRVLRGER